MPLGTKLVGYFDFMAEDYLKAIRNDNRLRDQIPENNIKSFSGIAPDDLKSPFEGIDLDDC